MSGNKTLSTRYSLIIFSVIGILLISGCQFNSARSDFNSDFEVNPEQNGWSAARLPQTKDFVKFAWDSTEHHNGKYSVSIYIDPKHPQDRILYNWTRTYDNFTIGKKYSLSGWVKTKDLKETAWIAVQFWNDNQKVIGFNTTPKLYPVKGTTGWTLVKTDFTVPDSTKVVRIRAGISAPKNNGGKVWFDDIKIE